MKSKMRFLQARNESRELFRLSLAFPFLVAALSVLLVVKVGYRLSAEVHERPESYLAERSAVAGGPAGGSSETGPPGAGQKKEPQKKQERRERDSFHPAILAREAPPSSSASHSRGRIEAGPGTGFLNVLGQNIFPPRASSLAQPQAFPSRRWVLSRAPFLARAPPA
jgi:hypothetical protein